jgi:hypothetical protein
MPDDAYLSIFPVGLVVTGLIIASLTLRQRLKKLDERISLLRKAMKEKSERQHLLCNLSTFVFSKTNPQEVIQESLAEVLRHFSYSTLAYIPEKKGCVPFVLGEPLDTKSKEIIKRFDQGAERGKDCQGEEMFPLRYNTECYGLLYAKRSEGELNENEIILLGDVANLISLAIKDCQVEPREIV